MSNLVNTSVAATDPVLTISACSNEVITGDFPEAGNAVGNSSEDMPNTSGHTSLTDVGHDADTACSGSCTNNAVVDESVAVARSPAEMCNVLERCAETTNESACLTQTADELSCPVSELEASAEPISGLLQSNEEHCRSDTVTFNLPLEVIGACWFMKPDTETCLQATTSNDEKIVIRLNKKDSRVTLTFEARSGRSLFSVDSDKCHCHIESLLEPPRRPSTSVTGSSVVASALGQRRVDRGISRTNSTSAAGTLIHGIASRLRARSTATVKYKDDDDTDDADNCVENDVAYLDDDDDFDVCDEDGDEGTSVSKRNSFASNKYCADGSLDVLNDTVKESLIPAGVDNVITDDDPAHDDRSSTNSDADDTEWSPKKPLHRTHIKRSRPPACLKFKLKTDPALDDELNAIRNDNSNCDVADSSESKLLIDNKRGQKMSLASKSLTKKLKHVSHKKSNLQTDPKHGVRNIRSKDGPKWEKKGVCPHCGVFYGNLGQHVGLYCPKNPNRQRAYHCCYCKFRSLDRATLVEHKATHVLARDFKCEICDSSFFTRQRLVRHMRYVHLLGTNPVRIYTCDRCGKRFRYHSHYDRHLTIHSEEKTAQCDQCGKFFKNSHNVRNHQSRMHPGKPEQFPFYCSKCGQGTHSLTAHRCIRPGEMHGSRRRRAPRNVIFPPSLNTSTVSTAISEDVSASSPPPAPVTHLSPPLQQDDQLGENIPTSVNTPNQAVDCSSVVRTTSSDSRPPSLLPLDCNVPSSRIVDQRSEVQSHTADHLSSPSSHSDVHYPSTSATQLFDGHAVPFDHLSTAMPVDRRQLSSGISRPSYHHSAQLLAASELPYDRRMAPSFQSQQPAVAHQPQQQPPYSNLFAVDPLLQLRAANMMYRVDY